jgi:hypothetical protein
MSHPTLIVVVVLYTWNMDGDARCCGVMEHQAIVSPLLEMFQNLVKGVLGLLVNGGIDLDDGVGVSVSVSVRMRMRMGVRARMGMGLPILLLLLESMEPEC